MWQILGKLAVQAALWALQHPEVVKQVVTDVHEARVNASKPSEPSK